MLPVGQIVVVVLGIHLRRMTDVAEEYPNMVQSYLLP